MSLRIIHAGIFSSIQDAGRAGFRASGIPVGGAMDPYSFRLANLLAGNNPQATVIEFTLHGITLLAESELIVALAGGGAELWINGQSASVDRAWLIKTGSLLELKATATGYRSYLAVSGGFSTDTILGSRSTYLPAQLGGRQGRLLKSGDQLSIADPVIPDGIKVHFQKTVPANTTRHTGWGISHSGLADFNQKTIRCTRGIEWDLFNKNGQEKFENEVFRISDQSDRMGYRLIGKPVSSLLQSEMISAAVMPGTIQVNPDGDLMLLMADAQTTGGYPRIAQVIAADIQVCAQLRPGAEIRFALISMEEAEELYLKQQRGLNLFEAYIEMNFHSGRK